MSELYTKTFESTRRSERFIAGSTDNDYSMLQQQATLRQLQPQVIDPEKWLVSQGRLQARNPDNAPLAERATFVKKLLRESENSECRQEALRYWEEADWLTKGYHWSDMVTGSGDYQKVLRVVYQISCQICLCMVRFRDEAH